MAQKQSNTCEIATWYDTWNRTGLDNLRNGKVPLNFASRYNLAFGSLVPAPAGGYTVQMGGQYADAVKAQIQKQAPGVLIYAGLGDAGIAETVADNTANNNRSTRTIVAWLKANGYNGISIDAEGGGMGSVADLVSQLGPSFRKAKLGIAVSVPWPSTGPTALYGTNAVNAFNDHVDALELQDYSSSGTPSDAPVWVQAGIKPSILMAGVSTENGGAQTTLPDTKRWTQYAMQNGLRGVFSWRLDNDHGTDGQHEDVDPTFTGARTIYDTVTGSRQ